MSDGLEEICALIGELGKIDRPAPDQDFYDFGFSSVRALDLLLELEDRWGVSIPDDRFVSARTPRALFDLVANLRPPQEA